MKIKSVNVKKYFFDYYPSQLLVLDHKCLVVNVAVVGLEFGLHEDVPEVDGFSFSTRGEGCQAKRRQDEAKCNSRCPLGSGCCVYY